MKKLAISLVALNLLGLSALSQNNANLKYYVELDSIVKDTDGRLRLNHVLRQEFSRIVKTNTNGIIGNYVGLSTKDNNLSFAYSLVRREHILQIKAGGGISDGITNLISNNELNTDINLGFNYYRMFGQKNISINFDKIKSLRKKDRELNNSYTLFLLNQKKRTKKLIADSTKAESKVKKLESHLNELKDIKNKLLAGSCNTYIDSALHIDLEYRKRLIQTEAKVLKTSITTLKNKVTNTIAQLQRNRNNARDRVLAQARFEADSILALKPLYAKKDSLKSMLNSLKTIEKRIDRNTFTESKIVDANTELEIAKHELKVAKELLKLHRNAWDFGITYDKYQDDKRKNLDKLKDIRAEEIELTWFGVGFDLNNKSFKLLDSHGTINTEQDLVPAINFSITRYINKLVPGSVEGRNISFTSLAARFQFGNNLSTLKEVTVETTDSLSENTTSITSQKAFSGIFDDDVLSGQIALDHYRFVGNKDNFGLHLGAKVDLFDNKSITSLRVGILFAALSQNDIKSTINFELFFGLNDIFKGGDESSLLSRNVIGIQSTIPFNFNL